jgi:proteasome assembly chaperone (PAC2) family protein
MSYLTILEKPEVELDYLIIAFGGWADAGESATTAIKFMQRQLGARKFAELDPEDFYDFSQTRPYTSRTRDGRRRVHWPANEFSYWVGPGSDKGCMTLLGVEPNLRWRTYSRTIIDLAQEYGVKKVVHIGALLDAVPHTRDVKLTGTATDPDLLQALEDAGIHASTYQGPTGISSSVMEACTNQEMDYLTLWGHTSHYLQAAPNYRIGYTLAKNLTSLLSLTLDLEELKTAATTFDAQVAEAVARDDQLKSYVEKLEGQYDESTPASEMPDPADMVLDVEQFLRSEQRRRPGDHQS